MTATTTLKDIPIGRASWAMDLFDILDFDPVRNFFQCLDAASKYRLFITCKTGLQFKEVSSAPIYSITKCRECLKPTSMTISSSDGYSEYRMCGQCKNDSKYFCLIDRKQIKEMCTKAHIKNHMKLIQKIRPVTRRSSGALRYFKCAVEKAIVEF